MERQEEGKDLPTEQEEAGMDMPCQAGGQEEAGMHRPMQGQAEYAPEVTALMGMLDFLPAFEASRGGTVDNPAAARDAVNQAACKLAGRQGEYVQGALSQTALVDACKKFTGAECVLCTIRQHMPAIGHMTAHMSHSANCTWRKRSIGAELGTWCTSRPHARHQTCAVCGLHPPSAELHGRFCNPCRRARLRAADPVAWAMRVVRQRVQDRLRKHAARRSQPAAYGDRVGRQDPLAFSYRPEVWSPKQDCADTQTGVQIFAGMRTDFQYEKPASHASLMQLASDPEWMLPGLLHGGYKLNISPDAADSFAVLYRNENLCARYLQGQSRCGSDLTPVLYSILLTIATNKDKIQLFVFGEMLPYKDGG